MLTPRTKLEKQWMLRNQAIQEQLTKVPEMAKGGKKKPTSQEKRRMEVTQLVARYPEMPAGVELNRHDRGKLEEITPV